MNGKEIKKLRQDLGFSQTMLAERIGASPSHISKWENDRNKISQGYIHKIKMLRAYVHPGKDSAENMESIATTLEVIAYALINHAERLRGKKDNE